VSGSANSTPTTGRGDDFSIIDVIATKFKDIIWNYDAPATADVETGTIKEGMDSGLTYKAYSGYVDSRFLIKIISTLKTSGGKPITGVATNSTESIKLKQGDRFNHDHDDDTDWVFIYGQ
jgi:hypothetical protein